MSREIVDVELYPSELLDWTEDFASRLAGGESITARAATAKDSAGGTVAGLVTSVAGSGTELTATFDGTAGSAGQTYAVDLTITKNTNEKTTQRIRLTIPLP